MALLLAAAAGCASVAHDGVQEQIIGGRLKVHLDGAWNHVKVLGIGPAHTWTMEELPVDQLRIYAGDQGRRAGPPARQLGQP